MKPKKPTTSAMWTGWTNAKGKCKQVAISVEGCDDRTLFEWYVFEDELEFLKLMTTRCNEVSENQCQPKIHIYEDLKSAEDYNKERLIV